MINITIPPAALEAGARALARGIETEDYWPHYKDDARAAFLAMIEKWPGMGRFEDETGWDVHIELPLLVPLTPRQQENSDE